jgi:integrase
MRTPGRHSVGDSLILAVSPSGTRSWLARVRDISGKRRDIGLGPYADVPLAEAREKARVLRNAGRDGQPILTRAEKRRAMRSVPTFAEAAERIHLRDKSDWKNPKHADQWINTLKLYAYPKLGKMGVDTIDETHVIEALESIWKTIPETARRVRQRILKVIDWAHGMKYRGTQLNAKSITDALGTQPKGRGNFAALPYVEVPALAQRLEGAGSIGKLALRFLILTAARSGEVRGAAWSEFDLKEKLWTIPGARMKAGKEHVVPLSDAACSVIEQAKAIASHKTLVFPGTKEKALSDATMAKALSVAGVKNTEGTVHGMRSAFRDWISEETNFPGDVAEAALAHVVSNKVEAAYRRGNLLAKRREMMTAWANYCAGASADVLQLKAVGNG